MLLLFLFGCSNSIKVTRISKLEASEINSDNIKKLDLTIVFGSIFDNRTPYENCFEGWWATSGNVPINGKELRQQIVKNLMDFDYFSRVSILDQTTFSSIEEEIYLADKKGADILVRSHLGSFEYSADVNGGGAFLASIPCIPFGIPLGAGSLAAALVVGIFGDEGDLFDYRWFAWCDAAFPVMNTKIQPMIQIELIDISTGEIIGESSIEFLLEKNVTAPLGTVKSAWIGRARELTAEAYQPISKDIAAFLYSEISEMVMVY